MFEGKSSAWLNNPPRSTIIGVFFLATFLYIYRVHRINSFTCYSLCSRDRKFCHFSNRILEFDIFQYSFSFNSSMTLAGYTGYDYLEQKKLHISLFASFFFFLSFRCIQTKLFIAITVRLEARSCEKQSINFMIISRIPR